MTAMIEIKEGSESSEIAVARFDAWLDIEKANRLSDIEEQISDSNRERARLNALPEAEQAEVNERRLAQGKHPLLWPLKPQEIPAWKDSFLSKKRVHIARLACTTTREEREALRARFSSVCDNLSSQNFQDVQHALGAWENGEGKRDEKARIATARQRAFDIIAKRKAATKADEIDFTECFHSFGPEGGGFHGGSAWRPEVWDTLP